MRGEQAIFNLDIKKKSGLSINPDIHDHSKVFSSETGPSVDSGRVVHVLWRTIICPLDVSRELFMDGQSFSRHTVSGSLAVHSPYCGHDLFEKRWQH